MDIDLGVGMDGTECASRMLAERNVPVVFLSSHAEPEVVEKTEKITSYGYVVKNSGSTILFASIKRAFKLFEADNRYRSLFGNNHTVMLIVDPVDGRIRDVNQAACDFYGWPRETLLSMKVSQIDTLSPDEIRIEMARAVAEKRKNYHFCHRRADGSVVDVDVHAGTIELDGKTWLLSVVHDMTEKLAALKEKDDLGKRLSHYLATSPTDNHLFGAPA